MNKTDYKIFKELAHTIRLKFPEAKIWAFGSCVNNNSIKDSDLDVCIVVNEMNDTIDKTIMDIAWNVGFNNDILISTVTYARKDFESGPVSAGSFVKSIIKHGIAA
ncbi:MAG: hypothetical protein A2W19_09580 [Spirochaetes bacterium RBG_16_49_21]|nr:MAG: hypothetical protein A2W19_09580 [Spirochaetes bacterium RBG_16_49_21]